MKTIMYTLLKHLHIQVSSNPGGFPAYWCWYERDNHITEQQIFAVLKSAETDRTSKDACHDPGTSETNSDKTGSWKDKYAGIEARDIKEICGLIRADICAYQVF